MEENSCLTSRTQASFKACIYYFEELTQLARRRAHCVAFSICAYRTRLKFPIAISSLLLAVVFIGCGGSGFQRTPTQTSSGSGSFQASTDTVDFGTVTVGQVVDSSVTLVNQGPAVVQISDLNVNGNGFAVASPGSLPISIAANGGQYVITLQFQPTAAGDSAGMVTVASSSFSSPSLKIKLHGKAGEPSGSSTPALNSLSCSQTSITGSASDNCTVALNAAAGSGGFAVSLASDNGAVSVPASLNVPSGATSAGFIATVTSVSTAQTSILTAAAGGVSKTLTLQLNASAPVVPSLPTLSLNSANIAFGNVAVNTVATQTVTFSSTGTTAVTVNSASELGAGFTISGITFPVTLNPGQSANLTVQFDPTVSGGASGQISIGSNSATNSTASVSLSGTGVPVPSALSCASSSMSGAGTDTCTVTLNATAPSGGTIVSLSSNNAAVAVPASVTVAPGSASASFPATAAAVSSTQTATLTAAEEGVSKTFAIQLTAGQATLSAVSCTSSTMTGSGTDACTVTLSGPATGSGLTVSLSSSDAAVTVPATVTVPANATSVGFSAAVSAVTTNQSTTLTATVGGVSQTFAIQLNAGVPTLNINASTIAFGDITLNTTATQSVMLSSAGTAAVTVSSATATGTGFSLPGLALPMTLNPGQTASLSVAFNPTTAVLASGKVTINSNSSTGPTATVSLSGTGVAISYLATLNWAAPSSSPDAVAGYNVYRAPTGTGSYQELNSSPDILTNYVDSNVKSGMTYDYVVKSVDASGTESSASNITTATIP